VVETTQGETATSADIESLWSTVAGIEGVLDELDTELSEWAGSIDSALRELQVCISYLLSPVCEFVPTFC